MDQTLCLQGKKTKISLISELTFTSKNTKSCYVTKLPEKTHWSVSFLMCFPDLEASFWMQTRSPTHTELCGAQLTLHIWGNHEYEKPLSLTPNDCTDALHGPSSGQLQYQSLSLLNMRVVHDTEKHVLTNSS